MLEIPCLLFGQTKQGSWLSTTTVSKVEMDEERVQESDDALMSQFPALSDQRPRRRFLGVQVPTDTVDPGFHLGNRTKNSTRRQQACAVEVLGEERSEDGDFIYAFFDDNVVRRVNIFFYCLV
jgi:hypothetical protein